MKLGLVLGGGGIIGMGFHAGALKALDERGLQAWRADVIVGTSAGAVLAGYLGAGWKPEDFYEYAHGRHPRSVADESAQRDEMRRLFTPMWATRTERVRRYLGSAFAMASARGLWRTGGRQPFAVLRRAFPSGMYSTDETRARFREDLPEKWPRTGLLLCAAELYSGKRVAFGAPGAPEAPFHDAVLASTAIPGVFSPVRIGDRHYVDGGVVSATSLDLAVATGCKAVLCVAPLGYRKDVAWPPYDLRRWSPVVVRVPFARILRREVTAARAAGVHVLVIRPWLSDLALLGANSMRHHDRVAVVEGARQGTHRLLDELSDHPVIDAYGALTR